MATTLNSSGVTFPDGTTQTSAGGAVNTSTVLAATAGASVGAVGTYAYAAAVTISAYTEGSTIAGSNLRYFGGITSGTAGPAFPSNIGFAGGGSLPGTWRAMGRAWGGYTGCYGNLFGNTLWLRIS